MKRLAEVALAGIDRQGLDTIGGDPEMAGLEALLPADEERRFLLEAGLLSVYAQAGQVPPAVATIDPAPAESLLACSKEVAEILTAMTQKSTPAGGPALAGFDPSRVPTGLGGEHDDLLPEALALLASRGLRLRHVLLPSLLGTRSRPLRRALLPVIGERGRWLARFNPIWAWVLTMDAETPPTEDAVPEDGTRENKREQSSRAYIELLRRTMDRLAEGKEPPAAWFPTILPGARSIAPELIDEALSLFPCPEPEEQALKPWHRLLTGAGEKLRLRQKLIEELTA
jgi:hypothetical protein